MFERRAWLNCFNSKLLWNLEEVLVVLVTLRTEIRACNLASLLEKLSTAWAVKVHKPLNNLS